MELPGCWSSVSGSCLTHGDRVNAPSDSKLFNCLSSVCILPVIVSWKCSRLFRFPICFLFPACNHTHAKLSHGLGSSSQLCSIMGTLFPHQHSLSPQWQNLSLFHSWSPISATAALQAKILNLDGLQPVPQLSISQVGQLVRSPFP